MERSKVIENVIIFGGIGAMAYLLLKKPMPTNQILKPKYTDEYGNPLTKDTFYYKGIKLSSICNATNGGTKYAEIERVYFREKDFPYIKELCDNLPYSLKNELDETLVLDGSDGLPNSCNELDVSISLMNDWISLYPSESNVNLMRKKWYEDKYNKFNCRDKVEALRTKSLVDLQTKGSINAENSVVNKGFTEQKTYIILGALVLLTGFYVVVKK